MLLKDYSLVNSHCLFCNFIKPKQDDYIEIYSHGFRNVSCTKCKTDLGIANDCLNFIRFAKEAYFTNDFFMVKQTGFQAKIYKKITTTEQIFDPSYFNLELAYKMYRNKDLF